MNDNLVNVITNNCCFDFENTPLLPGDIVCSTTTHDNRVHVKSIYEINPKNNKIKIKSVEQLKSPGNFCWVDGKTVLNITAKYKVDIVENLANIQHAEQNAINNKIIKKCIFGFGVDVNNVNIIFQLPVESKKGSDIHITDITNAVEEHCKTIDKIHLLVEDKQYFEFYNINGLYCKQVKLFNIKYPVINSSEYFFICEQDAIKSVTTNMIKSFNYAKHNTLIHNQILPLLKKHRVLPENYAYSRYRSCYF